MAGLFRRSLLNALLAVVVGTSLMTVLPGNHARAQSEESGAAERKTRKTPAMRESFYKQLSEAQAANENGQSREALRILDDAKKTKNLNSYEMAQLWSFYGYVYFQQDRFQDSIGAYQTVLRQENLPEVIETNTLYALAQLYFSVEDYQRAADSLNRWFALSPNPGPDAYVLLGQAYYQTKQYRKALEPIETAIRLTREKGKPVNENWWLLLRVLYYELEDDEKIVEVLETLVSDYPKREYWVQLSGMYAELGDERKQLLAYDLAHVGGFLTRGQDLVTLAQLLIQAGTPYKGALILEQGLADGVIEKNVRNYRLLAQAYQMAQEDRKSIRPLNEAARLSDDGELSYRLAQAYVNLDEWQNAVDALRLALQKGGLKRTDQANVLLGMALFNLHRYDQAKTAFRDARKDGRSSRMAGQWLAYIGKEQEREAELERALE